MWNPILRRKRRFMGVIKISAVALLMLAGKLQSSFSFGEPKVRQQFIMGQRGVVPMVCVFGANGARKFLVPGSHSLDEAGDEDHDPGRTE